MRTSAQEILLGIEGYFVIIKRSIYKVYEPNILDTKSRRLEKGNKEIRGYIWRISTLVHNVLQVLPCSWKSRIFPVSVAGWIFHCPYCPPCLSALLSYSLMTLRPSPGLGRCKSCLSSFREMVMQMSFTYCFHFLPVYSRQRDCLVVPSMVVLVFPQNLPPGLKF